MTTTVDVGEEIMVQGAGRIDALAAATLDILISKPSLEFGYVDIAQSIWTQNETLVFYNHGAVAKEFQPDNDGTFTGVTLSTTPERFTVAPSDSERVTVTLQVDNSLVPFPTTGSLTYNGSFLLLNILLPGYSTTPGFDQFFGMNFEIIRVGPVSQKVRVSDATDRVDFWATEVQVQAGGHDVIRVVHHPIIKGVATAMTLSNNSQDLVRAPLTGQAPPALKAAGRIPFVMEKNYHDPELVVLFAPLPLADFPMRNGRWEGDLYVNQDFHPLFQVSSPHFCA